MKSISKKLPQEKEYTSIRAVRDFKLNCFGDNEYILNANIIVLKSEEEEEENYLHNIFVDTQVDLGSNFHKIYIMWEQKFGNDFKGVEPQLFGIYSTKYYEMEYGYKELTIYSGDIKILIRA